MAAVAAAAAGIIRRENHAEHAEHAEHGAAKTLQRIIRSKVTCKHRFSREKLTERLLFESDTLIGTARLVNQLFVFTLFVLALRLSSNETYKFGIFKNLQVDFNITTLRNIATKQDFVQRGLPLIANRSKQFSLFASQYFDTGGLGTLELNRETTAFRDPLPGPLVNLHTQGFSLTAWVQTTNRFISGYIVRKRPVLEGSVLEEGESSQDRACWGWFLHHKFGPQLHYGAHDFAPELAYGTAITERQVEVSLEGEGVEMAHSEFVMLTLTVSERTISFWHNLRLLGQRPLPRQMTDCFNNGQGVLLGGSGMTLGVARYYPVELAGSEIEEIFSAGAPLSDISTSSGPEELQVSDVETATRTLQNEIGRTERILQRQEIKGEVDHVLAAAQAQGPPSNNPSPPGPLGPIRANTSTPLDPDLGRPYQQLLTGPYKLTQTFQDEDHRYIVDLNSFAGTGMTLSYWYRHVGCTVRSCGVYLLTSKDFSAPAGRICWSVWLENNALWYDNLKGEPQFQYPKDFVPVRFELQGDDAWRHMAFVMDEGTDRVRFYLDGEEAWSGPWGSAVSEADCAGPQQRLELGRTSPGWTYGAEVELADLRMYVHGAGAGAVTAEEVRAMAGRGAAGVAEGKRCVDESSEAAKDKDWLDTWGHRCDWYRTNAESFPAVCHLAAARAQCPLACQSRQQCFGGHSLAAPTYFTWDRTLRIERVGPQGTVCLGDDRSREEVLRECEAWVAAGSDLSSLGARGWAESSTSGFNGRRVNVSDCAELAASVDDACAFDAAAVRAFTSDVKANGGDFTVAFWVRPLSAGSQVEGRDLFVPHLALYGTMHPPQHNVALGLWANPNGEARMYSACDTGSRDTYENFELGEADKDGWTFVAVTRSNRTTGRGRWGNAVTDLLEAWEGSEMAQCLFDPGALFSALEVSYPMLVSPLMMVPKALSLVEVQNIYYTEVALRSAQSGPLQANPARIAVAKRDFHPRTVLVAPPVIFQTRSERSTACPYSFGSTFIATQHERMQEIKCVAPYGCSDQLRAQPELLMACPGPLAHQRTFGLGTTPFGSQRGYADLLYSVTDTPYVLRDAEVLDTDRFVDSMSETVAVFLVFFTPKFGITSVMTVSADFAGAAAAKVRVTLGHYNMLEGAQLNYYLAAQGIVLLNVGLMILDIVHNVALMARQWRRSGELHAADVVKQLLDSATAIMVLTFTSMRIPKKYNSAADVEEVVGEIVGIQWEPSAEGGGGENALQERKTDFFAKVDRLLTLIADEDWQNAFCNLILVVSLLRVIQCTSLHPRLALLTGTLYKAVDDLWHATMLIVLLMSCFAAIATWRFGELREDFGTFYKSMVTQFEMLFGEFPENWDTTGQDFLLYTVLYILVLFLLVQNFLLAIIVEAYLKVRQDIETLETEQEFFTDVVTTAITYVRCFLEGWPTPGRLGRELEGWQAKLSVGFEELERTGLFKSHASVASFIRHFQPYDFLQPVVVDEYEPRKGDKGDLAEDIERRVVRALGLEANLRELAVQSAHVKRVRQAHSNTDSAHGNGNGNGNGSGLEGSCDALRTPRSQQPQPPRVLGRSDSIRSAASASASGRGGGVGPEDLVRFRAKGLEALEPPPLRAQSSVASVLSDDAQPTPPASSGGSGRRAGVLARDARGLPGLMRAELTAQLAEVEGRLAGRLEALAALLSHSGRTSDAADSPPNDLPLRHILPPSPTHSTPPALRGANGGREWGRAEVPPAVTEEEEAEGREESSGVVEGLQASPMPLSSLPLLSNPLASTPTVWAEFGFGGPAPSVTPDRDDVRQGRR